MLLGGLWHGASWTFVVWGGLHGALLAVERRFLFRGSRTRFPLPTRRTWPLHLLRMGFTFAAVVLIFVFFRASSIQQAFQIVAGIAAFNGVGSLLTARLAATAAVILFLDLPLFATDDQTWVLRWPLPFRTVLYTTAVLALVVFSGHAQQSFIYFAF